MSMCDNEWIANFNEYQNGCVSFPLEILIHSSNICVCVCVCVCVCSLMNELSALMNVEMDVFHSYWKP
jgi:hypothetical protein